MIRLAAAFLAGVLVTYLVMSNLGDKADSTTRSGIGADAAGSNEGPLSEGPGDARQGDIAGTAPGSTEQPRNDGAVDARSPAFSPFGETNVGSQVATLQEAISTSNPSNGDEEVSDSDGGDSSIRSPVRSVPIPETHEPLVTKTPLVDSHADLETEERDEVWASATEGLLASFITGHPSGQEINLLAVTCRQTQCEIIGSGYGQNPEGDWHAVKGDLVEQSWYFTYLGGLLGESSGPINGEFRFITVLMRAGHDPPSIFP